MKHLRLSFCLLALLVIVGTLAVSTEAGYCLAPDVSVDAVRAFKYGGAPTDQPIAGQMATIQMDLRNAGDAASGGSFTTHYYVNGAEIAQETHSDLSPGQTHTTGITPANPFPTPGTYQVRGEVTGVTGEQVTTNNSKEITVTVVGPDFTVTPASMTCMSNYQHDYLSRGTQTDQTIRITSTTSQTFTISTDQPWLRVTDGTANTGVAPGPSYWYNVTNSTPSPFQKTGTDITLYLLSSNQSPALMNAGTYNGTITISNGSTQKTIPVSMLIQANGPVPSPGAAPTGSLLSTRSVTLSAGTNWIATGATLAAGQQANITVTGEILANCSWTGAPSLRITPKGCYLTGTYQNWGRCAIGKIGAGGTAFYVGPEMNVTATAAGELYLCSISNPNDVYSGSYNATVKVYGSVPDVNVEAVWIDNQSPSAQPYDAPYAGQLATLGADQRNLGQAGSGSYSFAWYVNGALVNSGTHHDIPAGGFDPIGVQYTFPTAGTYQVRYVISGISNEQNTTNNDRTSTVVVPAAPAADIVVDAARAFKYGGAPTDQPVAGQMASIQMDLRNGGTAASGSSFTTKYYVNGALIAQETHSDLAPGQTHTTGITPANPFPTPGSYQVKCEVTGVTGEQVTTNNSKEVTVMVGGGDFTVTPASMTCPSNYQHDYLSGGTLAETIRISSTASQTFTITTDQPWLRVVDGTNNVGVAPGPTYCYNITNTVPPPFQKTGTDIILYLFSGNQSPALMNAGTYNGTITISNGSTQKTIAVSILIQANGPVPSPGAAPTGSLLSTRSVTLPASTSWVATGATLAAGQQANITVTGEILANSAWTGAPSLRITPKGCYLQGTYQNWGRCAIGKIGAGGTPFYVGPEMNLTATTAGELYLCSISNPADAYSGSYNATVKVYGSVPDVNVEAVWVDNQSPSAQPYDAPYAGQLATLGADQRNLGQAGSGSYSFAWYVNGALVNSGTHHDIPAGGFDPIGVQYTFPTAGTYQVRYVISGIANEQNTTNNDRTSTVVVPAVPTADIVVDAARAFKYGGAPTDQPVAGQMASIQMDLRNGGTASSGSSFTTKYYVNGALIGQETHNDMAPGATHTTGISPTNPFPTAGVYTVRCEVTGITGEQVTTNNSKEFTVTVGAAPTPDLELTAGRAFKDGGAPTDAPIAGQQALIQADLKNIGLAASGSYSVKWYVDGALIHTTNYPGNLNPGDFIIPALQTGYTFPTAGTRQVRIEVSGVSGENNTNNNSIQFPVTVVESNKPDIAVEAVRAFPANGAPTANPLVGQPASIQADLRNLGLVASGGSFSVKYYVNGTLVATDNHSDLAAGAAHTTGITYTFPTAGTQRVKVEVSGVANENNTVNNAMEKDVTVVQPFAVTAATISAPANGQSIVVQNASSAIAQASLTGTGTGQVTGYWEYGTVQLPFNLSVMSWPATLPQVNIINELQRQLGGAWAGSHPLKLVITSPAALTKEVSFTLAPWTSTEANAVNANASWQAVTVQNSAGQSQTELKAGDLLTITATGEWSASPWEWLTAYQGLKGRTGGGAAFTVQAGQPITVTTPGKLEIYLDNGRSDYAQGSGFVRITASVAAVEPDFSIEAFTIDPAYPTTGQEATFSIRVRNVGGAAAVLATMNPVKVYVGNTQISIDLASITATTLQPPDAITVTAKHTFTAKGNNACRAEVTAAAGEKKTQNNQATLNVSVTDAAADINENLTITHASGDREIELMPDEQQTIRFSVQARNAGTGSGNDFAVAAARSWIAGEVNELATGVRGSRTSACEFVVNARDLKPGANYIGVFFAGLATGKEVLGFDQEPAKGGPSGGPLGNGNDVWNLTAQEWEQGFASGSIYHTLNNNSENVIAWPCVVVKVKIKGDTSTQLVELGPNRDQFSIRFNGVVNGEPVSPDNATIILKEPVIKGEVRVSFTNQYNCPEQARPLALAVVTPGRGLEIVNEDVTLQSQGNYSFQIDEHFASIALEGHQFQYTGYAMVLAGPKAGLEAMRGAVNRSGLNDLAGKALAHGEFQYGNYRFSARAIMFRTETVENKPILDFSTEPLVFEVPNDRAISRTLMIRNLGTAASEVKLAANAPAIRIVPDRFTLLPKREREVTITGRWANPRALPRSPEVLNKVITVSSQDPERPLISIPVRISYVGTDVARRVEVSGVGIEEGPAGGPPALRVTMQVINQCAADLAEFGIKATILDRLGAEAVQARVVNPTSPQSPIKHGEAARFDGLIDFAGADLSRVIRGESYKLRLAFYGITQGGGLILYSDENLLGSNLEVSLPFPIASFGSVSDTGLVARVDNPGETTATARFGSPLILREVKVSYRSVGYLGWEKTITLSESKRDYEVIISDLKPGTQYELQIEATGMPGNVALRSLLQMFKTTGVPPITDWLRLAFHGLPESVGQGDTLTVRVAMSNSSPVEQTFTLLGRGVPPRGGAADEIKVTRTVTLASGESRDEVIPVPVAANATVGTWQAIVEGWLGTPGSGTRLAAVDAEIKVQRRLVGAAVTVEPIPNAMAGDPLTIRMKLRNTGNGPGTFGVSAQLSRWTTKVDCPPPADGPTLTLAAGQEQTVNFPALIPGDAEAGQWTAMATAWDGLPNQGRKLASNSAPFEVQRRAIGADIVLAPLADRMQGDSFSGVVTLTNTGNTDHAFTVSLMLKSLSGNAITVTPAAHQNIRLAPGGSRELTFTAGLPANAAEGAWTATAEAWQGAVGGERLTGQSRQFVVSKLITTGTVAGVFTDKVAGTPVAGIRVSIKGNPNTFTTTDADGKFTLTVPAGVALTLVAEKAGYRTNEGFFANSTVARGATITADFDLERLPAALTFSDATPTPGKTEYRPGDEVVVTVKVKNTGGDADVYAVLQVLGPDGADVFNTEKTVFGTIVNGQTYTFTYRLTLKPDAKPGQYTAFCYIRERNPGNRALDWENILLMWNNGAAGNLFKVQAGVLEVPGNLSSPLTARVGESVNFTWSAVPGATGYEIKITGGNYTRGDSPSGTTYAYRPQEQEAGERTWSVCAVRGNERGAYSAARTITVNETIPVTAYNPAGTNWLLTNYLGNTFSNYTIESRGNNQYYFTSPGASIVFNGLYELRDNHLVMIQSPNPNYTGFIWEIRSDDFLYLTNSGYARSTLTRGSAIVSPPAPTISSAPATVTVGGSANLAWGSVSGAMEYQLLFDEGKPYANQFTNGTAVSYAYKPIAGSVGTHTWKVRARNAAGWGAWSAMQTITVTAAPAAKLEFATTPTASASEYKPGDRVRVAFKLRNTGNAAASVYPVLEIRLNGDANADPIYNSDRTMEKTIGAGQTVEVVHEFTLPANAAVGQYKALCWIRRNPEWEPPYYVQWNNGEWGNLFTVRLGALGVPGNLSSPAAAKVGESVNFTWSAVPGATGYEIKITGGNYTRGDSPSGTTYAYRPQEQEAGERTWSVCAVRGNERGAYSAARTITVAGQARPAFTEEEALQAFANFLAGKLDDLGEIAEAISDGNQEKAGRLADKLGEDFLNANPVIKAAYEAGWPGMPKLAAFAGSFRAGDLTAIAKNLDGRNAQLDAWFRKWFENRGTEGWWLRTRNSYAELMITTPDKVIGENLANVTVRCRLMLMEEQYRILLNRGWGMNGMIRLLTSGGDEIVGNRSLTIGQNAFRNSTLIQGFHIVEVTYTFTQVDLASRRNFLNNIKIKAVADLMENYFKERIVESPVAEIPWSQAERTISAPPAPTIRSAPATVMAGASATLAWSSVSGATEYELLFDEGKMWQDQFSNGTAISYAYTSGSTGEHTWKVRARNASGWGAWSAERTITVTAAPAAKLEFATTPTASASEYKPGDRVRVTFKLRNTGNADAATYPVLEIRLNGDPNATPVHNSDRQMAQSVRAGQTVEVVHEFTLPANAVVGQYKALCWIRRNPEWEPPYYAQWNGGDWGSLFKIREPKVAATLTVGTIADQTLGATVSIPCEITNAGEGEYKFAAGAELVPPSGRSVPASGQDVTLAANAKSSRSFSITLPPDATGIWKARVVIRDKRGNQLAIQERSFTVRATPPPVLSFVTDPKADAASYRPRNRVTVTATIRNTGGEVKVYPVLEVRGPNNFLAWDSQQGNINTFRSQTNTTVTHTFVLPQNSPTGQYRAFYYVRDYNDPRNKVYLMWKNGGAGNLFVVQ